MTFAFGLGIGCLLGFTGGIAFCLGVAWVIFYVIRAYASI